MSTRPIMAAVITIALTATGVSLADTTDLEVVDAPPTEAPTSDDSASEAPTTEPAVRREFDAPGVPSSTYDADPYAELRLIERAAREAEQVRRAAQEQAAREAAEQAAREAEEARKAAEAQAQREAEEARRAEEARKAAEEQAQREAEARAALRAQVRADQGRLSELGWYSGQVDGIAGPMTRSATRNFQDAAGLPVTGEVDAATRAALGSSDAPRYVPPPKPEPKPDPEPADDGGSSNSGGRTSEGYLIAPGSAGPFGSGGGTIRYTVEIADGLESSQSLSGFTSFVDGVLGNTAKGWTATGNYRLARTDDPSAARVRIVLASPSTVDRLCARAGLRTNGLYSCWNGTFAAINSNRWFNGVDHVSDQTLYRQYVINHEVGHGLGNSHRSCPGSGRLAPVMMQLTKSTYGCEPNAWPYP